MLATSEPSIMEQIGTAVIIVGVISLAVVSIVASRRQQGQHHRSGDALWDDLRKAHGLSRREVHTLRTVAERASLKPESLIFLEPRLLAQLADKDPESQALMQDLAAKLYV